MYMCLTAAQGFGYYFPTLTATLGYSRFISLLLVAPPHVFITIWSYIHGIISDLFEEKQRAMPMAIFSLGPLLGPAIGPVVGGFMTETVGYKWIFIVVAALCGAAALLGIPFFRETYAPVIRTRIAVEGDAEQAVSANPLLAEVGGSKWKYIWVNMRRPFVLLTRSSICFMLNLYMAL